MSFIPPDPENFSFAELALKWGVSEERIERYFKERLLKQLDYEPLDTRAPMKERKHIANLKHVLNQSARKQIAELLGTVPRKPNTVRRILSKTHWDTLTKDKKSDQAFQSLVESAGHKIDYIQLFIPLSEVKRFEKKYSSEINSTIPSLGRSSSLTVVPNEKTHQITPSNKFVKDLETNSAQKQPKGASPYDVTGRKEAIKTMILEGLQSFYAEKGRLPGEGQAFQEFLVFINKQFSLKPKPDYLKKVDNVSCAGSVSQNCITIIKNGVEKKTFNRKHISTQFYKFKKEFASQVTSESSTQP